MKFTSEAGPDRQRIPENLCMSGSSRRTSLDSNSRRRRLLIQGVNAAQVQPVEIPPRVYEPRFLESDESEGKLTVNHMLRGTHPMTWVFTGDGCTQGSRHTEGARGFVEHFSERVRWELRRFHDVVINTGIAGDRAASLVKTLEWRALRFRPDVVLILTGLNDSAAGEEGIASFQRALRSIIGRIQEAGSIPVLQTPNLTTSDVRAARPHLPQYVAAIRDIASCDDLPLIDHWRHWEAVNPEEHDLRKWLDERGALPAMFGHREMMRLICHEFGVYDRTSPVCTLDVP